MIDLEELKQMVAGGMSITAIAEELGVTPARVSQLVSALGLSDSTTRKSVLNKLTEEDKEEIVRMYQEYRPVTEILARFGLNYNALYKLLAQCGVEFREHNESAKEARRARLDHAVRLYVRGHPIVTIEAETGIRQPVLHRELHARGIPLRGRGQKVQPLDHEDDVDLALESPTAREQAVLEEPTAYLEALKRLEEETRFRIKPPTTD